MFETAELGRRLGKEEYEEAVPGVRTALLRVQKALADADFPVLILVNGVDGAGKGDCINRLHEWMDARYLDTRAYAPPTEEERQRPPYWRFWMWLPPRGRVGIFFGSWYTKPILDRAYGTTNDRELDAELVRVNAFEAALVADGALVIKLWFHVSREQQKRRFEELQSSKGTRWRVKKRDWRHHALYDSFRRICARTLRQTSTGSAPWTLVEGTDARHRDVFVARHIVERIDQRLTAPVAERALAPSASVQNPETILDTLDLSRSLPKPDYERELAALQARLNRLSRKMPKRQVGAILAFEGWDAAGKGGAIRRITHALDARSYRVIPIAAPTDEERAHHYLWRFWRHLPRLGRLTIYDRTWYGRVLVERAEGFASEAAWMRAYKEINDFEEQLVEHGIVLVKFWLHISADEQLRRFQERERAPWKKYKITPEDYRNREKMTLYELAASDMIARTSTEFARWTLIEANDKRYARVKILRTLCEKLEAALGAR
ncbi:MAG: polyphosphate:AMP phosphotransferase [Sorangiineae bacterium]|nr:polyphosphate:AMP phosphotransferase [Polyangiaceae bacterium]MEB2324537.1 polyphosphate:AMP phosphotransferase [Sorangiineae bacterium]